MHSTAEIERAKRHVGLDETRVLRNGVTFDPGNVLHRRVGLRGYTSEWLVLPYVDVKCDRETMATLHRMQMHGLLTYTREGARCEYRLTDLGWAVASSLFQREMNDLANAAWGTRPA